MPAGRPSSYDPSFALTAAAQAEGGATDPEIADALGIGIKTLYRWRNEFPEFRQALKAGKAGADDRVERSLFERAVGYSRPAVKIMQHQGVVIRERYIEHVPPDPGAAKLWLSNRRPAEWREKIDHDVTVTLSDAISEARKRAAGG